MKLKIKFEVKWACSGVSEAECIKATVQNPLRFQKTLRKELEAEGKRKKLTNVEKNKCMGQSIGEKSRLKEGGSIQS